MKNYFNKYYESYKRYGLISFVNQILSKIGLKMRFKDPIQKKRIYLSKKLNELTNGEIIDGIYKGSKLIYSSDFFLAKPAQLLGCYEKEVQEKIFELSKKYNLNYFLSIGAGEGYHAIGSRVAKLFEHSLCFELEKKNREIIKKNFKLNLINENFDIFGKADLDFLQVIKNKVELRKSLFLFDIEGDEFKILNQENLRLIKDACLIVELHHFYLTKSQNEEFLEKLRQNFKITFIITGNRKFSNFKILDKLNDDEKWLSMSESRPATMNWIICEPLIS